MASTVSMVTRASPAQVFAVLADPDAYGHWVVGSSTIRDADPAWPGVGSRFHHRVGAGPLGINDFTEVLESVPGRRLVLLAHARPVLNARVELELVSQADGATRITMHEEGADPRSRALLSPLVRPLSDLRNAESLRRLRRLAEQRPGSQTGT